MSGDEDSDTWPELIAQFCKDTVHELGEQRLFKLYNDLGPMGRGKHVGLIPGPNFTHPTSQKAAFFDPMCNQLMRSCMPAKEARTKKKKKRKKHKVHKN